LYQFDSGETKPIERPLGKLTPNMKVLRHRGKGGSLDAIGSVATGSDFLELQRLVITQHPPLKVLFEDVFVEQLQGPAPNHAVSPKAPH